MKFYDDLLLHALPNIRDKFRNITEKLVSGGYDVSYLGLISTETEILADIRNCEGQVVLPHGETTKPMKHLKGILLQQNIPFREGRGD